MYIYSSPLINKYFFSPDKLGRCPTPPPDTAGICVQECEDDTVCPGDHKCCSNGCGQTCTSPEPDGDTSPPPEGVTKEGACPVMVQSSGTPCIDACSDDNSCPADQKCCANADGCGNQCVPPLAGVVEDSSRPGECPSPPEGAAGICLEMCNVDTNCPGDLKCCSNGCGHVCTNPVTLTALPQPKPQPVIRLDPARPGVCLPTTLWGRRGSCGNRCDGDKDCPGILKCCSNGCGRQCARGLPARMIEILEGFITQPDLGRGEKGRGRISLGRASISSGTSSSSNKQKSDLY